MIMLLGPGGVRLIGEGDGWNITCPKCGRTSHVRYRVAGPDGLQTDFVAPGAVLKDWKCEMPVTDKDGKQTPCGYVAKNIQLEAA